MLARKLLLAAADSERLERWFRNTRVAMIAVGRFMPGERLEDALDACRRLNAAGLSTVLSELGEHVTNEAEAARARDHYMSAIDRIEALGVDAHISVKLTQLGLEIADEMAFAALVDVAAHGERAAVEVWIDMESSAYTEATLRIYGECRDQGVNPGIWLHRGVRGRGSARGWPPPRATQPVCPQKRNRLVRSTRLSHRAGSAARGDRD